MESERSVRGAGERGGVAGLSAVERGGGGKKLRGGRLIRKHRSKAEENLLA